MSVFSFSKPFLFSFTGKWIGLIFLCQFFLLLLLLLLLLKNSQLLHSVVRLKTANFILSLFEIRWPEVLKDLVHFVSFESSVNHLFVNQSCGIFERVIHLGSVSDDLIVHFLVLCVGYGGVVKVVAEVS